MEFDKEGAKKRVHNFLRNNCVPLDQRVEMPGGGQYLRNLLLEFRKEILKELIEEEINILKQLKKDL
jgi:hypothetical protein